MGGSGSGGSGFVGVVLAAGAGRRMGGPKALIGPLAEGGRTPLARVADWVHQAGCSRVIAVIGARSDDVREALAEDPVWAAEVDDPVRTALAAEPEQAAAFAPALTPVDPAQPSDPSGPGRHVAGPPPWLTVVEASDWDEGMGASLRAGLRATEETDAHAALITLVDLPDVRTPVYRRMMAAEASAVKLSTTGRDARTPTTGWTPAATEAPAELEARRVTVAGVGVRVLARAAYRGSPGHPVLIGREHWSAVAAVARGDEGARRLFATTPHDLIECGDLASGADADVPTA